MPVAFSEMNILATLPTKKATDPVRRLRSPKLRPKPAGMAKLSRICDEQEAPTVIEAVMQNVIIHMDAGFNVIKRNVNGRIAHIVPKLPTPQKQILVMKHNAKPESMRYLKMRMFA